MQLKQHVQPVDYLSFGTQVSRDLAVAKQLHLPWRFLMQQRSMGRMRASLIYFGHLLGKRTAAKRQRCIYCGMPGLSLTYHVTCTCEHWSDWRTRFWSRYGKRMPATKLEQVAVIWSSRPGQDGYEAAFSWVANLDKKAMTFWRDEK